jgi:hypothetical protein
MKSSMAITSASATGLPVSSVTLPLTVAEGCSTIVMGPVATSGDRTMDDCTLNP